MKKISLLFLGVLLSFGLLTPVLALSTALPYGVTVNSLPLTDAENDVYETTEPVNDWAGIRVDSYDELDFQAIELNGNDLYITFFASPNLTQPGYTYEVYINNDTNSSNYEFSITATYAFVLFSDELSNLNWNGTSWIDTFANCTYMIVNNSIIIQDATVALPILVNCTVAGKSLLDVGGTYYEDRIVDPTGAGIPSFTWIYLYFSFLPILGLFYFLRKPRRSC